MSRQQGIQDSIMRWLTTGPADDTKALAIAMGMDTTKVTDGVRRLKDLGYVDTDYKPTGHGGRPMFTNIRLSQDGSRNIPEPTEFHQVGHGGFQSLRPADGTDYRNQPSRATVVGPTIRTTPEPPKHTLIVARVKDPIPANVASIGRTNWTILESIRVKVASVEPLRKAMAVLAPNDPLRAMLDQRIKEQQGHLTAIEQEYLSYAAANPPGPRDR
jgi:hypothetical protein